MSLGGYFPLRWWFCHWRGGEGPHDDDMMTTMHQRLQPLCKGSATPYSFITCQRGQGGGGIVICGDGRVHEMTTQHQRCIDGRDRSAKALKLPTPLSLGNVAIKGRELLSMGMGGST